MHKNQEAINAFFDGFGPDTAKEYSETIVDLIALTSENESMGRNYKQDVIVKLKDLNRLVLQLTATKKIEIAGHDFVIQQN